MQAKAGTGRSQALVVARPPDLPSELESLLHTVWACEADWRLNDRIDLALRREQASAGTAQRSRRSL